MHGDTNTYRPRCALEKNNWNRSLQPDVAKTSQDPIEVNDHYVVSSTC